jgi:hypothetical protein
MVHFSRGQHTTLAQGRTDVRSSAGRERASYFMSTASPGDFDAERGRNSLVIRSFSDVWGFGVLLTDGVPQVSAYRDLWHPERNLGSRCALLAELRSATGNGRGRSFERGVPFEPE